MRKIILFSLLASTYLFAERYMMMFEYNFIKGCAENGGDIQENRCICMLNEIEKVVSEAEMIDYSIKAASGQKTPEKVGAKIMDAAIKCAN